MMTFNNLHAAACSECGQSEIMLKQVRLNDANERAGQEEFKQDKFENCLQRAIAIYMPYYDPENVVHEKYANLYALSIANHRSETHKEDRADEIGVYMVIVQTSFVDGDEMAEAATRRWWMS